LPAEERAFGKLLALLENSPKCEEVPSDVVAELPLPARPPNPTNIGQKFPFIVWHINTVCLFLLFVLAP
jgi:hypothetical protein